MRSKREAEFTTKFKKYLSANPHILSHAAAIEIKVAKDGVIPFDAVKDHQLDALMAVSCGTFIYKIPDAGWQNPFDLVYMRESPAFLVFAFPEARKKTVFFLVPIEEYTRVLEMAERKSITRGMLLGEFREHSF